MDDEPVELVDPLPEMGAAAVVGIVRDTRRVDAKPAGPDDAKDLAREPLELAPGERHAEEHVRVAAVERPIGERKRPSHVELQHVDRIDEAMIPGLLPGRLERGGGEIGRRHAKPMPGERDRVATLTAAELEDLVHACASNAAIAPTAGRLGPAPYRSGTSLREISQWER